MGAVTSRTALAVASAEAVEQRLAKLTSDYLPRDEAEWVFGRISALFANDVPRMIDELAAIKETNDALVHEAARVVIGDSLDRLREGNDHLVDGDEPAPAPPPVKPKRSKTRR